MSDQTITILVPTYHRHKMLARTLDSIISQSYSNLIVRVHDNGSDNETLSLMSYMTTLDSRISYHRHPKNMGAKGNYESLINSVTTPYYAIINDDDFLLPDHLETGMRLLLKYPEAYFYSSATVTVNLTRNKIEFRNQSWDEGFFKPSKELTCKVIGEHFASTGTIFSSRILSKVGCFHPIGMDDVLSVLLTGCFPFVVSPRIGAVFTVNEKRDRWYFQKMLSLEEILKAGALDRKFVINYSCQETELYLLKYLEYYYGDSIQRKAIYSYRYEDKLIIENICEKKFFEKIFESFFLKTLKMHAPNCFLDLLTNLRFLIRKYIYGIFVESKLTLNFNSSLDYLKNSNLEKKQNFYNDLQRLRKFTSL